MNWYYEQQGQAQGPLTEDDLRQKVQQRQLPPNTLVWRVDQESWLPVRQVQPSWIPEEPISPPEDAPQAVPTETPPITENLTNIKGANPASPRLKPKATTGNETEPAPKKKSGGFLKRLFGGSEG